MNWSAMMALGLGVLRLSPEAFWSMTPRELSAALSAIGPPAARSAMTRPEFDALADRYPDKETP